MITNFEKLCEDLERQELESSNGVASGQVYTQLLALYLHQYDLCNAKLLWKRIPRNITVSNPEILAVWSVGQKLWKKDLPATYLALGAYNWSEVVSEIMTDLRKNLRERCLNLIGQSYSTVSMDTVITMTGLSKDAVISTCQDRKWQVSSDGTMITPVRPTQPAPLHTSSEDQLFKLTDFVSFLEN